MIDIDLYMIYSQSQHLESILVCRHRCFKQDVDHLINCDFRLSTSYPASINTSLQRVYHPVLTVPYAVVIPYWRSPDGAPKVSVRLAGWTNLCNLHMAT